MIIDYLRKNSITRRVISRALVKRANEIVDIIDPFLKKDESLLDIGAGNCSIFECLIGRGYEIAALDVADFSFVPGVKPVLYDGETIPFVDGKFGTALLISVLHHTQNPEVVLAEAARVSPRLVIMEDIYSNPVHGFFTRILDNLLNLEFSGNPHSNMSDAEWRTVFSNHNLVIKDVVYHRSFLILRHVTYFLEKQRAVR